MSLNIRNNALILAAQNPVSSLSITNEALSTLNQFYNTEVDNCFGMQRWHWCSTTDPLVRVNKTEETQAAEREDYFDAVMYERPANAVSVIDVWTTERYRESVEYRNGYYNDKRVIIAPLPVYGGLTVKYIRKLPDSVWPAWFQILVEGRLALRLAERFKIDLVSSLKETVAERLNLAKDNDLRQIGSNRSFAPAGRFTSTRNVLDGGYAARGGRYNRTSLRNITGAPSIRRNT